MTLFFRAFFLMFFIGAEARSLLGNHHGLNKLKPESGSWDDITPITTTTCSSSSSEKVGKPHLPPPPPKADDGQRQTIITGSDSSTTHSNTGRERHTPAPPSPHRDTPIGQLKTTHALQASY
ncbi:hypothetical protein HAX54_046091 [Datura stramonium]|uniref:Secreted protein n=1 Tax=Datura stramonium TaxID=4076 RepID=A0ABS8SSF5_DATST|nr:hypothetical protein [Datura stramonium]